MSAANRGASRILPVRMFREIPRLRIFNAPLGMTRCLGKWVKNVRDGPLDVPQGIRGVVGAAPYNFLITIPIPCRGRCPHRPKIIYCLAGRSFDYGLSPDPQDDAIFRMGHPHKCEGKVPHHCLFHFSTGCLKIGNSIFYRLFSYVLCSFFGNFQFLSKIILFKRLGKSWEDFWKILW